VDFLRFPWCYGPLIRGSPDLGRRRSDLPPAATWRVGDGRREGADRGQVSAIRRHRHRSQQVRALNHRIGAQGVHPRSVAARWGSILQVSYRFGSVHTITRAVLIWLFDLLATRDGRFGKSRLDAEAFTKVSWIKYWILLWLLPCALLLQSSCNLLLPLILLDVLEDRTGYDIRLLASAVSLNYICIFVY
jgi:hypothetical protein